MSERLGKRKRKMLALRSGDNPGCCPACLSPAITFLEAPAELLMSHVATMHGICVRCGAIWEAYPPKWSGDVCEGEPCDNCAFSKSSPEQADTAAWNELIAKLKAGQEFRCHKGAPILHDGVHVGKTVEQLKATPADVKPAVGFDAAWVVKNGRGCVGFWRMIWALQKKNPEFDWLAERYGKLFVCGNSDVQTEGPA